MFRAVPWLKETSSVQYQIFALHSPYLFPEGKFFVLSRPGSQYLFQVYIYFNFALYSDPTLVYGCSVVIRLTDISFSFKKQVSFQS